MSRSYYEYQLAEQVTQKKPDQKPEGMRVEEGLEENLDYLT